ncbi:hypothetical protein A7U60_g4019 [Sanghuangporus baumii]|uniref:Uncharacterized protein n=1 Tax=Sanghuangporus baumii TaxID=108892 RepID=A0A9Q5N9L6_SANBA|nr:hypothetical protein A7U60_g4019 [Sanghuangporus baumii]
MCFYLGSGDVEGSPEDRRSRTTGEPTSQDHVDDGWMIVNGRLGVVEDDLFVRQAETTSLSVSSDDATTLCGSFGHNNNCVQWTYRDDRAQFALSSTRTYYNDCYLIAHDIHDYFLRAPRNDRRDKHTCPFQHIVSQHVKLGTEYRYFDIDFKRAFELDVDSASEFNFEQLAQRCSNCNQYSLCRTRIYNQ